MILGNVSVDFIWNLFILVTSPMHISSEFMRLRWDNTDNNCIWTVDIILYIALNYTLKYLYKKKLCTLICIDILCPSVFYSLNSRHGLCLCFCVSVIFSVHVSFHLSFLPEFGTLDKLRSIFLAASNVWLVFEPLLWNMQSLNAWQLILSSVPI